MDGGICINEGLIKNGYLRLKEQPTTVMPLEKAEIDWSKTKAWGAENPRRGQRLEGLHLVDVAPTLLHLFEEEIPQDMLEKVICN